MIEGGPWVMISRALMNWALNRGPSGERQTLTVEVQCQKEKRRARERAFGNGMGSSLTSLVAITKLVNG